MNTCKPCSTLRSGYLITYILDRTRHANNETTKLWIVTVQARWTQHPLLPVAGCDATAGAVLLVRWSASSRLTYCSPSCRAGRYDVVRDGGACLRKFMSEARLRFRPCKQFNSNTLLGYNRGWCYHTRYVGIKIEIIIRINTCSCWHTKQQEVEFSYPITTR